MSDLKPDVTLTTGIMSGRMRWRVGVQLWKSRILEYMQFDSPAFGFVRAWAALVVAIVFAGLGRNRRALELMGAAQRTNQSSTVSRIVLACLAQRQRHPSSIVGARVESGYREYLASITAGEGHLNPQRIIGNRLIVLKSGSTAERGVIVIDYTYVFPLIARFSDLDALARRYHIVLEPSWVGYCTPEILLYSRLSQPVFVETNEPPDARVLQSLSPALVQVPMQANWWVDHRVMRPHPEISKDTDISMVAGWGRFKRHGQFFDSLARLRRRGVRLKVILVGYGVDGSLTRDDVYRQARYYGVADQLEIFENLQPGEVSVQISRTKVHVLWSRREGSNRAIIEAMLTDVPGILRQGYNYGYHYPYINPQTGSFATEATLPDVLLSMTEAYQSFSPRAWVLANMTPQIATELLARTIEPVARARGEQWSGDLVVKTAQLNQMTYWDPAVSERFTGDYEYIRSLINLE